MEFFIRSFIQYSTVSKQYMYINAPDKQSYALKNK